MAHRLSGQAAPRHASSTVSPESATLEFLHRLKTPCRLLVAYSGGGDSTGLLVALAEGLKANPGMDVALVAATVDHGLRPGSADEAGNAGELCTQLGVPHHILTWTGEKPLTGIQSAARNARYRLLDDLATRLRADLIVTAHNRDDQIETLAMRKARNPEAAGGISEAVLFDRHVWVCRPFLDVGRADIRDYLAARGIGWVDDPSNDNEKFERVRLRKTLAGAVVSPASLVASDRSGLAREAADFLLAHAAIPGFRVATLDLTNWSAADPAHLLAVLHLAAVIGGRTHIMGKAVAERIACFLTARDAPRLTAERVVFDRRKDILYLVRECRSLRETVIAPGSKAVWDNRFRIHNHGPEPVRVGARGKLGGGMPLLNGVLDADLPKSVRQRVLATEPVLVEGRIDAVTIEPMLAQFDQFLPADLLQIANRLAFLGGLDHFPKLPTR